MSEISEKRKTTKKNELKEWILSLIIGIAIAFVIRVFVLGRTVIKGISMEG